jgi:transcriptional regulator with XRE-family HTH domain
VRESIHKTFGKVVRKRREASGLSQEALADLAGIHRTYISSIELGKVRLGLEIAQKVADGLKVALSELIAEAERDDQRPRRAKGPSPRG